MISRLIHSLNFQGCLTSANTRSSIDIRFLCNTELPTCVASLHLRTNTLVALINTITATLPSLKAENLGQRRISSVTCHATCVGDRKRVSGSEVDRPDLSFQMIQSWVMRQKRLVKDSDVCPREPNTAWHKVSNFRIQFTFTGTVAFRSVMPLVYCLRISPFAHQRFVRAPNRTARRRAKEGEERTGARGQVEQNTLTYNNCHCHRGSRVSRPVGPARRTPCARS